VPSLVQTGIPSILLAPFLGLLASFVVGSATLANLLFGSYVSGLSNGTHYTSQLLVSVSSVGATVGGFSSLLKVLIAANTARTDGIRVWKRTVWISIMCVLVLAIIFLTLTFLRAL
jgi:L-lactate permease